MSAVRSRPDAGFFDGLVHGLSINVSALRRGFGAPIGIRDFFAGLAYEIGLGVGVGVGLLLAAYNATCSASASTAATSTRR